MEFNKPVINPMLVGCIELMRDEDSREHRDMFMAELVKAQFLSPAIMVPPPVVDESGRMLVHPATKVQFPMIEAPDGRKFFMAFTDMGEYQRWEEKAKKKVPFFALTLQDYAGMLLQKDAEGNMGPALGFVINPLSTNVIVPREMVAGIMSLRMAKNGQRNPMPAAEPEADE